MKSRSNELLDRAIAAMMAAVEIYNKPVFPHKAEGFTILAINGWELLLKAKWLSEHQNKERSLYVYERRQNKNGKLGKKRYVKKTRSGAPFTYGLAYLAEKLVDDKFLDVSAQRNIEVMLELRDCATHFYNQSSRFNIRLYEIGAACVKNFTAATRDWFGRELSEFGMYLMPLAFVGVPDDVEAIVLNAAEKNFLLYLDSIDNPEMDPSSPYTVTVNIDIRFTRSKAHDALVVTSSNDPAATKILLTEEQIREQFPWDYFELTKRCVDRYIAFKVNQQYHDIRKSLEDDDQFARVRFLDPGNPKSAKKPFFNPNIFSEFDKHYVRK